MNDPQLTQLSADMRQLTTSISSLINSQSRLHQNTSSRAREQEDMRDELLLYGKQLTRNKTLTEQQNALLRDAIEAKRLEIKALKDLQTRTENAAEDLRKYGAQSAEYAAAQKRVAAGQEYLHDTQQHAATTAQLLTESFGGLLKGSKLLNVGFVMLGATLKGAWSHAKEQIVANRGLLEGTSGLTAAMISQQSLALTAGFRNAAELAKVVSANRQMVNSMGGTSQTLDELSGSLADMYVHTGDNAAANAELMNSMSALAQKGIKPTSGVISGLMGDFKQLTMLTGMSIDQMKGFYDELSNDADMIDQLRMAREGERAAILANQRSLVNADIALGMIPEQAKNVAKALSKISGEKPLDRLKKAQRIRVLGAAMGISGSGEAANAYMRGARTPEDKKAYEEFGKQAANSYIDSMREPTKELFASILYGKLGLEEFANRSDFSTKGTEVQRQDVNKLKDKTVDAAPSALVWTEMKVDLITNGIKSIADGSNFLGPILAAILTLGGIALTSSVVPKLLQLLPGQLSKNLMSVFSKVGIGAGAGVVAGEAAAATSDAAAGATKGAAAWSATSKLLKVLGPLASIAQGVVAGRDEYNNTHDASTAAAVGTGTAAGSIAGGWGGSAAGAALGTMLLPGIGTIVGGVLGAALGGWGGGELGAAAAHAVVDAPKPQTELQMKKTNKGEVASSTSAPKESTSDTLVATGIERQLKAMGTTNSSLEQMLETLNVLVELNKKQLAALDPHSEQGRIETARKVTRTQYQAKYAQP